MSRIGPLDPCCALTTLRRESEIPIDRTKLADYCRRWQISELSLFGSVLRDDFRPDSDVDVLVTFAPGSRHGLFAVARMAEELERLLGRKVDFVTRTAIEADANYILRRRILGSLTPVYVA
jgi:predicted nucleotidyltransferase